VKKLRQITVVLLRGAETLYNEALKDVVEAAINFYFENVEIITKKLLLPTNVFDRDKGQFDAEKIIDFLNKQEILSRSKAVIALIDEDIFYGKMSYIFGLAAIRNKKVVVSTYRLRMNYTFTGYVSIEKFKERVFKELLHEIGHIFGLKHCLNKQCVMSFSNTLKEVDDKLPMLCDLCLERLRELSEKIRK